MRLTISRLIMRIRSRRDGRSANGTLTLRRTATTPIGQGAQSTPSSEHPMQHSGPSDAAATQSSTFDGGAIRYTRDDLLAVFRSQKGGEDPSRLFIPGWDPSHVNGSRARGGWGNSLESHVPQDPGACWAQNGDSTPIGLHGLSSDEKEVRIPVQAWP